MIPAKVKPFYLDTTILIFVRFKQFCFITRILCRMCDYLNFLLISNQTGKEYSRQVYAKFLSQKNSKTRTICGSEKIRK